jgi:hypothetical protein
MICSNLREKWSRKKLLKKTSHVFILFNLFHPTNPALTLCNSKSVQSKDREDYNDFLPRSGQGWEIQKEAILLVGVCAELFSY